MKQEWATLWNLYPSCGLFLYGLYPNTIDVCKCLHYNKKVNLKNLNPYSAYLHLNKTLLYNLVQLLCTS